jgi:Flp pilus assembly pilin Flp
MRYFRSPRERGASLVEYALLLCFLLLGASALSTFTRGIGEKVALMSTTLNELDAQELPVFTGGGTEGIGPVDGSHLQSCYMTNGFGQRFPCPPALPTRPPGSPIRR